MSLIHEAMTDCVHLKPTKAPDKDGGTDTRWEDGDKFLAAIVFDGSSEREKAEKAGTAKRYTVTVPKTVKICYHDVFRREKDGRVFRAVSDSEKTTPKRATFQFSQFTAEEWRLPK